MAFNQFTLQRVQDELGVVVSTPPGLFAHIPPAPFDPAAWAAIAGQRGLATTINTEKARSELLIAPVLVEAWRRAPDRVALFSGVAFPADPAAELTGVCDFILGRPPQLDYVTAPVLMIAEAKNESIMGGLGQCAAAMVGAQRFNARRNSDITTVYGAVTDGEAWRFLRLRAAALEIDVSEYLISEPDQILGVILHFLGIAPTAPAAAA